MSKIDYQGLREAAERAIPAMERLLMLPYDDDLLSEQELKDYGVDIDALNAFKFLTGPENVLALLDELDKWKQESSAWQVVAGKQLALATNAEQKIAELESLTAPKLPQPAPVSVPEVVGWEDVPEEITEDDIALASAWAIGFNQCRAAMLKLLCNSEQLDEVGSWNNHRNTPTAQDGNHTEQNLDMVDHFGDATKKAMLHGAEPVSQTYKSQHTQFEQVADLYEMQFDDGRTCAFHTDAQKAAQWLQACDGNRVQEYVKLERLRNALSGNYPVTPDGWISCSERMPNEEDVLVYCSDTKEQMVGFHKGKGLFQFFYMNGVEGVCEPSHWMPLPEPPQEAK